LPAQRACSLSVGASYYFPPAFHYRSNCPFAPFGTDNEFSPVLAVQISDAAI